MGHFCVFECCICVLCPCGNHLLFTILWVHTREKTADAPIRVIGKEVREVTNAAAATASSICVKLQSVLRTSRVSYNISNHAYVHKDPNRTL